MGYHSPVIEGCKELCEQLTKLSEVKACNAGKMIPRASSHRGVTIVRRDYDVAIVLHASNGMQRFTVKPADGVTLDKFSSVVERQLSKDWTILSRKEESVLEQEIPRNVIDALREKSEVDHSGRTVISGINNLLMKGLGLNKNQAIAMFRRLQRGGILIDTGEKVLERRSSVNVYLVQGIWPPALSTASPVVEIKAKELPAAVSEPAEISAQERSLIGEALTTLWAERGRKAELLEEEISGLRNKIEGLQQQFVGKEVEKSSICIEIEEIEKLRGRF